MASECKKEYTKAESTELWHMAQATAACGGAFYGLPVPLYGPERTEEILAKDVGLTPEDDWKPVQYEKIGRLTKELTQRFEDLKNAGLDATWGLDDTSEEHIFKSRLADRVMDAHRKANGYGP